MTKYRDILTKEELIEVDKLINKILNDSTRKERKEIRSEVEKILAEAKARYLANNN